MKLSSRSRVFSILALALATPAMAQLDAPCTLVRAWQVDPRARATFEILPRTASTEARALAQSLLREFRQTTSTSRRVRSVLEGLLPENGENRCLRSFVLRNGVGLESLQMEAFLQAPSGVREGYSVGEHSVLVLQRALERTTLLRRFSRSAEDVPAPWNGRFFHLLLLMHDIGKGLSERLNQPDQEESFSVPLIKAIFESMGFSADQALVAGDLILHHKLLGRVSTRREANLDELERTIRQTDAVTRRPAVISGEHFFLLLMNLFAADASSYPAVLRGSFDGDGLYPTSPPFHRFAVRFVPIASASIEPESNQPAPAVPTALQAPHPARVPVEVPREPRVAPPAAAAPSLTPPPAPSGPPPTRWSRAQRAIQRILEDLWP